MTAQAPTTAQTTEATAAPIDFEANARGHLEYVASEALGPDGSQKRSGFSNDDDGRTGSFAFNSSQEAEYATLGVLLMQYFQFSEIDIERFRGTRGLDGVVSASGPLADMSWSFSSGEESRITLVVTADITADVPE